MGMRRLFLDDNPIRCSRIADVHKVTICKTAQGCINYLAWGETRDGWDIVYLDHDLGDETMVDSDRKDCGMEVVRWVEEHHAGGHPPLRIGLFVIHTWNVGAGEVMTRSLEALGYDVIRQPFQTKTMEIGT